MNAVDENTARLLRRLSTSNFRAGFKLSPRDTAYLQRQGLERIKAHAREFVAARLSVKNPPNDGRQTPFYGHPVFTAQHATATCCRGCLQRWHKIPRGRALSKNEIEFVLTLIMAWIKAQ